jgi:hypothetical protein
MTPSPGRSVDSNRDGPPLYAQFNGQGVLDVPDTLLTIARRFEKLERWTVAHVRALEERMGDVERWLVDKEKEKEEEEKEKSEGQAQVKDPEQNLSEKSSFHSQEDDEADNDVAEIREELIELQGRVGELGREMAKLMTAPLNLSSGPARSAGPVVSQSSPAVPPTPTSIAPRTLPTLPATTFNTPRQQQQQQQQTTPTPDPTQAPVTPSQSQTPQPRPKESTSPTGASGAKRSSSVISTGSGRTRLPYPTGDYTSPPGVIPTKQDILSPTNSPPSSLNDSTRRRPLSIAGLPSATSSTMFSSSASMGPSTPGLPQRQEFISTSSSGMGSPPSRALSPKSPPSASGSPSPRAMMNVSPTPRKRYTVALGMPLNGYNNAPDSDEERERERERDGEMEQQQRRRRNTNAGAGNDRKAGVDSDVFDESHSSDDGSGGSSDGHVAGGHLHSRESTIGKSTSASTPKLSSRNINSGSEAHLANPPTMPNDTLLRRSPSSQSQAKSNSYSPLRVRAQSSYGPPSGFNASLFSTGVGTGKGTGSNANPNTNVPPAPITPLRVRVRSKSIDRVGLGIGVSSPAGNQSSKFVDPLVLRRQEAAAAGSGGTGGGGGLRTPRTPVEMTEEERLAPLAPVGDVDSLGRGCGV